MRWMPIATALVLLAAAPHPSGFVPPASKELIAQITALDKQLFDAIFETCEPDKVAALVADDFEFVHDKWGQTAKSGKEFVEAIRGMCRRQQEGTDYRARRELDAASQQIYPLNKYGAVQIGFHRFFSREGKELESARFMNLWKNEDGRWRLARSLSYDHREAK